MLFLRLLPASPDSRFAWAPHVVVRHSPSDRERCGVCASLVRNEYCEMPGLSLTRDQAARLWCLTTALADAVLAHLVREGFLRATDRGTYVRADLPRP